MGNRLLRELGWVQVRGSRDSPRNSELDLWPKTKLLSLRGELLSLMKKSPETFIARIFSSHDSVWVDRCSGIIRDIG